MTRKRLFLHFDLNRTTLMSDAASGRSMENTVDYLLSECSWGTVGQKNEWLCSSQTVSPNPIMMGTGKNLITYKKYVDSLYPYKSLSDLSNVEHTEEIKKHNKIAKKRRMDLQSAFTQPNAPGSSLRHEFDRIMEALHFPNGQCGEFALEESKSLEQGLLADTWKQGRYFLLPSFLDLLWYLDDANNKHTEIEFCIVFRTFGTDLPEVAKELELLTKGRHPLYPNKKIAQDFRLASPYATFYRDGIESNDSYLILGTLEKIPDKFVLENPTNTTTKYYQDQNVQIHNNFQSIQNCICNMVSERRVIGLRDYWEWWNSHGEKGEYGKLLLVNNLESNNNDLNIFFDDHIEHDHAHIVDVRDLRTGEPIPFDQSKKKYLRRVEPYLAITDTTYYIKCLQDIINVVIKEE